MGMGMPIYCFPTREIERRELYGDLAMCQDEKNCGRSQPGAVMRTKGSCVVRTT